MAGGQAGTDQSTDDQAATRTVARLGAGGTSIEGLTRQLQSDEAAEAKQLAPLQAQRAQAVQAITAARQGAPAEPKYGDIPKAPQFKPEGDPLQLFANPAIFLTVLGSLRTRAPMTAAMNAMAAGLNAAHEGRLDAMKAAREQYKDNVDAVVAQNQIESQRYTASLERYKNNMDALKGSLDAISTEFNDVQVQHLLRQDNIRDVISLIQERNRQAEAMQAHADKIIEMSQAHQDRMMQLQVEKERLSQGKWVPMTVQPFVDAQGKQQPARTVMFNDHTHEVLEANGQPADPSTLGVLSKAATGGGAGSLGARAELAVDRITRAANGIVADTKNIMELPATSNAGIRGDQTGTIFNATKNALVNTVTPQEMQTYNAMVTGLQRNMATLEALGWAPSGALTKQMDGVVFQPGDTGFTKLHKMAQIRQSVETSLEPSLYNPKIPDQEKVLIRKIIDNIKETIPFTHHDLIQYQRAGHPSETITDFMNRTVGGAGAPAASGGRPASTPPPAGVEQEIWDLMTPEQQALWKREPAAVQAAPPVGAITAPSVPGLQ